MFAQVTAKMPGIVFKDTVYYSSLIYGYTGCLTYHLLRILFLRP